MPKFSSGSPTMVPADRRGLSDEYGSWKTSGCAGGAGHMAPGLSLVTSSPPSRMRPGGRLDQLQHGLADRRLAAARLAHQPSVSPLAMAKLTPSTAFTAPTRRCSRPPQDREVLDQACRPRARARSCQLSRRFPAGDGVAAAGIDERRRRRRGSDRSRARSAAAKAQPTIGRVSDGTRPGISCRRGRVPPASASTSSRGIARIRPRV